MMRLRADSNENGKHLWTFKTLVEPSLHSASCHTRGESPPFRTKALEYFDQAKGISGLDFDSSGILDDSIQAVCLMLEEGLQITFAQRLLSGVLRSEIKSAQNLL